MIYYCNMKLTNAPAILLRLSGEEKNRITKEAKKLGISATSFLKLLVKQYFDGIRFERQKHD